MQYKKLGSSELHVSELCLGTMTFGQQNTLPQAMELLDCAVSQGINFLDAAETYPVPMRAETQGYTEEYIGHWLKSQPRDKIIVATKIAGPSRNLEWLRRGPKAIDRRNIEQAVHGSLKRLQTDYIDLYQIHWPDRYVPLFGQGTYERVNERETTPIFEQLSVLSDLVQTGKVRYIGLSNETPWGVSEFIKTAEESGLIKVVSIQNAYSLVNRIFEFGLAETCRHEDIGLLAYSPLAFGHLSGKYLKGFPPDSRLGLFKEFGGRYNKPNVGPAVSAYVTLAHKFNISPAVLALAFVRTRWFVTSTIMGATTLAQLSENIKSTEIIFTDELLKEINEIHERYPNPAP